MKSFSKLLAQSLLWRGLYFITLFIVNLVLSRNLGAGQTGVVYYISNTFSFVQLIAGLCLETGITYFAAGKQISPNRLLWLCLLWTGFIMILQVIIFSIVSLPQGIPNFNHIPFYAYCFITGLLLTTYGSSLFYALGNFIIPNFTLAILNTLFVLYVFVMIQTGEGNVVEEIIQIYFLVYLVGGILITLAFIIKQKSWKELALPDINQITKFGKYSLTVLLFNVLLFLVYRIDYYFVRYSHAATEIDLGNYIQASKLGQMLLVIPQIIGSAVYPQVSSGVDMPNVSKTILGLMKGLALLFICLFVFVFFVGDYLFPFLFGSTFTNVKLPFLCLLPGIYGLAIISFLSNFFSGQGNVSISVKAAFYALFIVVAGDAIFVFRYGIVAAALVSSVGYLVLFSFYTIPFKNKLNLNWKDFFVLGEDDLKFFKKMFLNRKTR